MAMESELHPALMRVMQHSCAVGIIGTSLNVVVPINVQYKTYVR